MMLTDGGSLLVLGIHQAVFEKRVAAVAIASKKEFAGTAPGQPRASSPRV